MRMLIDLRIGADNVVEIGCVRERGEFELVRVSDFEPHVLQRKEGGDVKLIPFFGYQPTREDYVRVPRASGHSTESTVPKPLRQFLIDTDLSGGTWFTGSSVADIERLPRDDLPRLKLLALWVESESGDYRHGAHDKIRCIAYDGDRRGLCDKGSEREILLEFEKLVARDLDPDVLLTFDNRGLGLFVDRFKVLCGRSPRLGRDERDTRVSKVTTYSKDWIRSRTEQRMASANNLETHRMYGCGGRIAIDLLRFLLMRQSPKLTSYSFEEAWRVVLGRSSYCVANRRQLSRRAVSKLAADDCRALVEMGRRLNCVAEIVETARATGLDLDTVQWQAASVRTEQLLLKAGRKLGIEMPLNQAPDAFKIGWAHDTTPFLHHPLPYDELQPHQRALVDSGLMGNTPGGKGSTGLYHDPVAILDFASLYPSIFCAHNLCHSTYVVPSSDRDETASEPRGYHQCPRSSSSSPTHTFVSRNVREGLVPRLLRSLMQERKAVKARIKRGGLTGDQIDCLEARQLSLKMCANATYGYCGSSVSSLEAKPLAETCLRFGNFYCREAIRLVETSVPGARVIYAQTDSLFVLLPGRNREQAKAEAMEAVDLVNRNVPEPIKLEFQRVLQPFLLLQVNRYAGNEDGIHHVKGIGVDRGSPDFVKRSLHATLRAALLECDLDASRRVARGAVDALTSGRVDVDDLVSGAFLWRQDQQDLERMAFSGNNKAPTQDDVNALRTPHVALAVRLLTRVPQLRFRLGEFVPSIVCASSTLKTQSECVEDPFRVLLDNLPVDLKLYANNKLRPDLSRVLDHLGCTSSDLEARKIGSGLLSCSGAHDLLAADDEPRRGEAARRRFGEHFFYTPRKNKRRTVEDYLELLRTKRVAERQWARLMAERHRVAARVFGNDPEAHEKVRVLAAPLANLARRLQELQIKLDAFDDESPATCHERRGTITPRRLAEDDASSLSEKATPPPRQRRREDDDAGEPSFVVRATERRWSCAVCTYVHDDAREAEFLQCAVCDTPRGDEIQF